MRRRWVSSVILMVVVGGSFGAVAETATSKPVDLEIARRRDRRARAVVAGDIVTVRASIQKLTAAGGAATSFRFLYTVSRGLKLLGITTSERQVRPQAAGRVALMQLRPGKPIVFTIRARVLAGASSSVALSAAVYPGARLEGHEAREQRRRPAVAGRATGEADRPRRHDHGPKRRDPPWVAEHLHRHRDEPRPDDRLQAPVASGHQARVGQLRQCDRRLRPQRPASGRVSRSRVEAASP